MPSAPAFKIIVYAVLAVDEQLIAPDTAQFIAGLFIGYDAHARWTVSGATADGARAKMEEFWAKERKSYEPRPAPKKRQPIPGIDAEPAPVSVADDGEVL